MILPFKLRLGARVDGERLPSASVEIRHRDIAWSTTVSLPKDDDAIVEMWQGGRYTAIVDSAYGAPYFLHKEFPGGVPAEWVLDPPNLTITGTVEDETTKRPIPNAPLSLKIESPELVLSFDARSDAQGKFAIRPVAYGRHTLLGAAAKYEPGELTYQFEAPDEKRAVTLVLRPVSMIPVSLVNDKGSPASKVRVLFYRGSVPLGRGWTDANGVVEVPVADGQARDVYAIPPDGGFVAFQVKPGDEKLTIAIPASVSTIVVNAISDAGQPIQRLAVHIRHNGRLLPVDVVQEIGSRAGSRSFSDANGRLLFNRMPAGLYELWPVESFDRLPTGEAPVKFVAVAGENVATLTFAAK